MSYSRLPVVPCNVVTTLFDHDISERLGRNGLSSIQEQWLSQLDETKYHYVSVAAQPSKASLQKVRPGSQCRHARGRCRPRFAVAFVSFVRLICSPSCFSSNVAIAIPLDETASELCRRQHNPYAHNTLAWATVIVSCDITGVCSCLVAHYNAIVASLRVSKTAIVTEVYSPWPSPPTHTPFDLMTPGFDNLHLSKIRNL